MESAAAVLEDPVLVTAELALRPREPDYAAENRALVALARQLATTPGDILQGLAEAALELCRAHSAGLSLIEDEEGQGIFRWAAIAGRFAPNVNGTTPRDFSPCGVVVDSNAVQLFHRPGRQYPYLDGVSPPIVEALLQPFSVDGRPIGTIWAMANDEERKFDAEDARALGSLATFASGAFQVLMSLRAAKDADQRKDEFLAVLSHEMRTPLHTSLTWLQVLRQPSIDAPTVDRAHSAIERSVTTLSRMIDDLLDISRIDAGKLAIELQETDLVVIVRRCIDALSAAATEQQLAVDVAIEDESLPVFADPVRIQQVVSNLLSNSIKFTPAGGRISIRARRDDGHAEVAVSDTGEGVPPEMLPFVFERFQQADASVSRRHGGLGLGLAVARHYVERHGGTIEALSDGAGCGSTFVIRLPIIRQTP